MGITFVLIKTFLRYFPLNTKFIILDTRNIEAAQSVEQAASAAQEAFEDDGEVTPVFPTSFHEIPLARPKDIKVIYLI